MPEQQNLEAQIVSQAAERRVSDELAAAEQIDIYVQTDLLKIVQGQAHAVTVAAQGLITKHNLRVQEIKLKTDGIAINPIKAIFGEIQLHKPVNLIARIILHEADINSNLNSDFSRQLVSSFQLDVDGVIFKFALEDLHILFPEKQQIELWGKIQVKAENNSYKIGFNTLLLPQTDSHPIMLKRFNCTEGEGISLEFILSFIQKVKELVNLPYLQWEDIKFRIKNMHIQDKSLILLVEANLNQVPNSLT
jgi:3-polyprenyl-4-hydroxybenzoate decarboxylase